VKLRHFSLPNLLSGEALVPEFFQGAVTPAALAAALLPWLTDADSRRHLQQRFRLVHDQLRRGGAQRAAQLIIELAEGSHA
jgi:lipid-A-disaccharide synthase